MIYNFLDKYIMNDFSSLIVNHLDKKKKFVVFDIGCFQGNFSRNLKNKLFSKKIQFYLFDPNPNIKLRDFKHYKIAFSNIENTQNYYLNDFFPSSGSSLKTIVKNDKFWNLTRKFLSFNMGKKFKTFVVKTQKLDNFCKSNKISQIDVLKIDVEGSEMEVLMGAKNILKKTKIIQVEILGNKNNFNTKYKKLISYLKKYNFKIISIKSIWSVGILSNMKSKDILLVKI